MTDNNVEKYLEVLWFSEKEAKIYLSLLRWWISTGWDIAKDTNISRSTVYQVLWTLITKNIVFSTIKNNIKVYIAEEPNKILLNLEKDIQQTERKKKIFQSIYPDILKIKNIDYYKPKVIFFEWVESYIKLLDDVLKSWEKEIFMLTPTKISSSGKNIKSKELYNYEVWVFLQERLKRKIFMNLITTKKDFWEEIIKKDPIQMRTTKLLPDDFWEIETMIIYWDNVLLLNDNHPVIWIFISDKQMKKMMHTLFYHLWNTI